MSGRNLKRHDDRYDANNPRLQKFLTEHVKASFFRYEKALRRTKSETAGIVGREGGGGGSVVGVGPSQWSDSAEVLKLKTLMHRLRHSMVPYRHGDGSPSAETAKWIRRSVSSMVEHRLHPEPFILRLK